MKKMLTSLLLAPFALFGQEFKTESRILTGVFESKDYNKAELFILINKWISINYNSAKNVLQLNDMESGTIILKGINEITYKNNIKILYPNDKYMQEYTSAKFNHLIEINIKENKYRIIYKLIDMLNPEGGTISLTSKFYSFEEISEAESLVNWPEMDESFRKYFVGAEKREAYKNSITPMNNEINNLLLNDAKSTMLSIFNYINSSVKDDW
jgi:hypothetical protein